MLSGEAFSCFNFNKGDYMESAIMNELFQSLNQLDLRIYIRKPTWSYIRPHAAVFGSPPGHST